MIEFVILSMFLLAVFYIAHLTDSKINRLQAERDYADKYVSFYHDLLDMANEDIDKMDKTIEEIRMLMEWDAINNMTETERIEEIHKVLLKHYGNEKDD